MATFFGALVFTGLGALFVLRGDGRSVLPWVVVALVLCALVVVLTLAVNLPLNDQIKGDPAHIANLAAVRERFDEAKWVRWNLVRAVASTVAFGCLTWALVLHGRVTQGGS
jgi:uncharacterized membrane protein